MSHDLTSGIYADTAEIADVVQIDGRLFLRVAGIFVAMEGNRRGTPESVIGCKWTEESLDLAAEQINAAASRPAPTPPGDSTDQRARVISEVTCRLHRVPAEDLSRLHKGRPSEDRYLFEPIEPLLIDESLTHLHSPDRHPGKVFFYRANDPDRLVEPIRATYDHPRPEHCRLTIEGETWWRVSCKVVFREEQWCIRWLIRREEPA